MPEMGCEDGVAIADQGFWQAMHPDDLLDELRRHVRSRQGFGSRDEDCLLREAVHDHEDCVMVVVGRKVGYPVQRDTRPGLGREGEGG